MANYASGTSSSGKSAKSSVDVDNQAKTCVQASMNLSDFIANVPIGTRFKLVKQVYCQTIHIGDTTEHGGIVYQVSFDPLRGSHGLEVHPANYPDRKNWNDARDAVKSYGPGWRLPTKEEQALLYNQYYVVGSGDSGNYWSSTEDASNTYNAWATLMAPYDPYDNLPALQESLPKMMPFMVRAVRKF